MSTPLSLRFDLVEMTRETATYEHTAQDAPMELFLPRELVDVPTFEAPRLPMRSVWLRLDPEPPDIEGSDTP